jgi:multidrug efflux pump
MTSVATVAGHFPLILASGPGAGSRNSIGTVLVTGMTIGTFFTLFVVPSIYVLIARNHSADRQLISETTTNSELEHAAGVASIRGDVLFATPREAIANPRTSDNE